jgi:hypothetical protein
LAIDELRNAETHHGMIIDQEDLCPIVFDRVHFDLSHSFICLIHSFLCEPALSKELDSSL